MPSRLEPADQTIEAVLFPVRIGLAPVSIEPQAADLTIVRAQYFQRLVQVIQIGVDVALESWLIPVEGRVIEERQDSFNTAAVDEFCDQIASGCAVRCIMILRKCWTHSPCPSWA